MFSFLLQIILFLTLMVPLTGVIVHKLSATAFLLLCLIHIFKHRKSMNVKKYAALALIAVSFGSGILGFIYEEIPLILAVHKVISIGLLFWLAIHIYTSQKKSR